MPSVHVWELYRWSLYKCMVLRHVKDWGQQLSSHCLIPSKCDCSNQFHYHTRRKFCCSEYIPFVPACPITHSGRPLITWSTCKSECEIHSNTITCKGKNLMSGKASTLLQCVWAHCYCYFKIHYWKEGVLTDIWWSTKFSRIHRNKNILCLLKMLKCSDNNNRDDPNLWYWMLGFVGFSPSVDSLASCSS